MEDGFSGLEGKVVLVTGGSSGIGFSCARIYCELGCKVVINSRGNEKLSEATDELKKISSNIRSMKADIRNIAECRKLIEFTVKTFGTIDVLINNAGVFEVKNFVDHTEADFDDYFETLIKGPFFLSKYVVPHFIKQNSGVIINLGSVWGLQGIKKTPCAAYTSAKSAIHALTQALSVELAPNNIRVLSVAPGLVNKNDSINQPSNFSPLGIDGVPSDVSSLIVFLTSNRAKFMTGSIIPVDGGFMAGRV